MTFAIPELWSEVGIISQFSNNYCPRAQIHMMSFPGPVKPLS